VSLNATSNTGSETETLVSADEHMSDQHVDDIPWPPASDDPRIADLVALLDRQIDLLQRWELWGAEIRRRVCGVPTDLRFELSELSLENAQLRADPST
jgi:hypothetical protein